MFVVIVLLSALKWLSGHRVVMFPCVVLEDITWVATGALISFGVTVPKCSFVVERLVVSECISVLMLVPVVVTVVRPVMLTFVIIESKNSVCLGRPVLSRVVIYVRVAKNVELRPVVTMEWHRVLVACVTGVTSASLV